MATWLNYLPFISFVIISIGVNTKAQTQLQSPCPGIFQYDTTKNENNRWSGAITLLSDSGLSGVWLRIVLDRPAIQLGNWFGEVKLRDSNTYLVKDRNFMLKPNTPRTVKFWISYDPNKPVPRLVAALLNGRQICPEGPVTTPPPPTEEVLFTSPPQEETGLREPSQQFSASKIGVFNQPEAVECGTIARQYKRQVYYFYDNDVNLRRLFNSFYQGSNNNMNSAVLPLANKQVRLNPLILGGQKTKPGDYPWHIALYHYEGISPEYKCGGTLISQLHVITAGHCVTESGTTTPINPSNLQVILGKYHLKKWANAGLQERQVSRVIRHPRYNYLTYANDIAVIKLANPVEFTNYVRPICLWEGSIDYDLLVGQLGTVVGWGFDESGQPTEELNMVKMPITSEEVCISSFEKYVSSKIFCAGFGNGTSVCNGDSGGGMIFPKATGNPNKRVYQLRGLVSVSRSLRNELRCDPRNYVIFTDVAKYLDFIGQAMAL